MHEKSMETHVLLELFGPETLVLIRGVLEHFFQFLFFRFRRSPRITIHFLSEKFHTAKRNSTWRATCAGAWHWS